jgi:hypothetical protein
MVDRWAECGGVGGLLPFERGLYVAGLASPRQCMVAATDCPLPGPYAMVVLRRGGRPRWHDWLACSDSGFRILLIWSWYGDVRFMLQCCLVSATSSHGSWQMGCPPQSLSHLHEWFQDSTWRLSVQQQVQGFLCNSVASTACIGLSFCFCAFLRG